MNTKKIVTISLLITISVVFSIFDKIICSFAFPFLPMVKIGIANIVIIIGIRNLKFKEVLLLVIMKTILANLIYGGLISFIIGGLASLVSFIIMYILNKYLSNKISLISVSVIGGTFHIITQLIVTYFLYKLGDSVLAYGGLLIIASLITSIIVGIISIKLDTMYKKIEES